MPAPLEGFLRVVTSGNNVIPQEILDVFGGDAILDNLRKYDPDARLVETRITEGGEAGGGGENDPTGKVGYRLEFDWSKLPASKAGKDWSINPSDLHEHVKDQGAVYDDPVYGKVTNSSNFYKDADPLWTKLAPLAVGTLAPMAGAALAGAGIGGAAGLTAAATGSGLGGAATIPKWAVPFIAKAPQYAGQISQGNFDTTALLKALASYGATTAGVPSWAVSGGNTLASLLKNRGT